MSRVFPNPSRAILAENEKEADSPSEKRNTGTTKSGRVRPMAGACLNQSGMPVNPAATFTGIMTKTARPRRSSSARQRCGTVYFSELAMVVTVSTP